VGMLDAKTAEFALEMEENAPEMEENLP